MYPVPAVNKCAKEQFMHLLTATCCELHVESGENHKK